MTIATWIIGDREWIAPAIVIAGVSLAVLCWRYRRVATSRGVQITAGLLKATAVTLLAVCLVNPLWSGSRAVPAANVVAVVVDDSASLSIHDAGDSESRGARLEEFLAENPEWKTRLAREFDVRQFSLSDNLVSRDLRSAEGSATHRTRIGHGLKQLAKRLAHRPVAGVLLFTDGNATDWERLQSLNAENSPPVYPVLVGSGDGLRDLAINRVAVSQSAFEDAPVLLRADVSALGLEGADVVAKVLNAIGDVVAEETRSCGQDGSLSFRFRVRPKQPGLAFFRVEAHAADEAIKSQEATLRNNTLMVVVDRGRKHKRILYVGGRPNWEFKFLNRAVESDEQLQLAALIRISKREAKFDFRGRANQSSNSLFRGFKQEHDEETERYDEPVIVRLNMQDADELREGFPKKAADLYGFDAVILDDVEAKFFTQEQQELLRAFVSERGGGLLMLGGQESFFKGGYRRTPLEDVLPAWMDKPSPRTNDKTTYQLRFTRDGWLAPWVRLRATEEEERERFRTLPVYATVNRLGRTKPGASVLAEVTDGKGNHHPALVAHQFGSGRAAAFAVGDAWRMQLESKEQTNDLAKAWRQMLRWLVADVRGRVSLTATPAGDVSPQAMRFQVMVRDRDFKACPHAEIELKVTPPKGESFTLAAEPSLSGAGVFEAVHLPRHTGGYRVAVVAKDDEGKPLGAAEAGWVADTTPEEFHSVTPNRQAMAGLADRTGGAVLSLDDLPDLAETLAAKDAPVTAQWTYPLWHQSWMFVLVIGCLAGEWGLRRWKGLA